MAYLRLSSLAIACLLTASPSQAADELSSETIYAMARTALTQKNCERAKSLLTTYKLLEGAKLRAHRNFAAQIDEQIAQCTSKVEIADLKKGLPPGVVIEGRTRIDGEMGSRSGSVD